MPAIDIPDPLPPAITPPRDGHRVPRRQDLEEFGDTGLVARTWHWVLHGGGPGPISHMDWSQFDGDGPPSAATLAAESTADEPPLHPPTPWPELNKARFICWLVHRRPGRRSTATLPPVGNGPRTCRHRGRIGHRHHARGLRPADSPAVATAKATRPMAGKPAHAVACGGEYASFLRRARLHHLGDAGRRRAPPGRDSGPRPG